MKNNQNKLLTVLFSLLVIVIALSASAIEIKTQAQDRNNFDLLLNNEVEQQLSNSINRSTDEFDFLSGADTITLLDNEENQASTEKRETQEAKQTVQLREVELKDKPTSTTTQETTQESQETQAQVQETTQVTQASKTEETQVMQTSPTTEAQQVEQEVQQQVLPDMYGSSVYFMGDSLAYGVEYSYGGNVDDSSTVIGASISSIVNNNSGYVYGDIVYVSAGINDIAAGRVVTPEMIDLVMSVIPSSSTVIWMDYYWTYGNQYLVEQSNTNLYNSQYRYDNLHIFNWSDYAYNYISNDGLHANEYMSVLNIIRNKFRF